MSADASRKTSQKEGLLSLLSFMRSRTHRILDHRKLHEYELSVYKYIQGFPEFGRLVMFGTADIR